MAGLFGTFESPEIVEARRRAEITAQLDTQRQQQLAGLQAGTQGSGRLGATLGFALGGGAAGLFGNQVDAKIEADPELMATKQQREMLQGISEVEAAPGTSDFFAQAALKVQEKNPAMAMELGMRAQQARAAEAKAAAAEQTAARKQELDSYKALDSKSQRLAIEQDPTIVNRIGGQNLDDEELASLQQNLAAYRATEMALNEKRLETIKGAKTPKTTNTDRKIAGQALKDRGYGGHTFENSFGMDNEESFQMMNNLVAESANQLRAAQAQAGRNVTITEARNKVADILELYTTRDGPDDATAVDMVGFQQALQQALSITPQSADEAPQAPASTVDTEEEFDIDLTL